MARIRGAFAEVLAVSQDASGDIVLPDPFSPGNYIIVELNARERNGFRVYGAEGRDLARLEAYVRSLFACAGIDPGAELGKLRDAGCTCGGAPVLSFVPKD